MAVYEALAASRAHPTADDLHRLVVDTDAGISLATVYNTLEALCQAGIAHKLPGAGENGSARYDAARDNHLHLRCRQTGTVTDVPDDLGQQILEQLPVETLAALEDKLGFKVDQVQIELVGRFIEQPV
jgi:Fur family peroxide stress response transcriptional regulator